MKLIKIIANTTQVVTKHSSYWIWWTCQRCAWKSENVFKVLITFHCKFLHFHTLSFSNLGKIWLPLSCPEFIKVELFLFGILWRFRVAHWAATTSLLLFRRNKQITIVETDVKTKCHCPLNESFFTKTTQICGERKEQKTGRQNVQAWHYECLLNWIISTDNRIIDIYNRNTDT